MERNLKFLLDPWGLALCHWTARSEGRKGPERVCAGFLLTLERLGLFNYWAPKYRSAPRLDCPVPTYPSLAEFTLGAPAQAQSGLWSRWWAWLENQPAHRRVLLLQELYSTFTDGAGI